MKYFLACVDDEHTRELMGSYNQVIIDDLKTLKGVLNRIKRYNLNHGKDFKVYQFYGHLLDNNLKLVYQNY